MPHAGEVGHDPHATGSTFSFDETRPRGRRFHTVSCQKLIRTYQFGELRENLKGIMVNKGRIHREFRYFRDIFWNLVKLDDELR